VEARKLNRRIAGRKGRPLLARAPGPRLYTVSDTGGESPSTTRPSRPSGFSTANRLPRPGRRGPRASARRTAFHDQAVEALGLQHGEPPSTTRPSRPSGSSTANQALGLQHGEPGPRAPARRTRPSGSSTANQALGLQHGEPGPRAPARRTAWLLACADLRGPSSSSSAWPWLLACRSAGPSRPSGSSVAFAWLRACADLRGRRAPPARGPGCWPADLRGPSSSSSAWPWLLACRSAGAVELLQRVALAAGLPICGGRRAPPARGPGCWPADLRGPSRPSSA
jgi:hypothetical protein